MDTAPQRIIRATDFRFVVPVHPRLERRRKRDGLAVEAAGFHGIAAGHVFDKLLVQAVLFIELTAVDKTGAGKLGGLAEVVVMVLRLEKRRHIDLAGIAKALFAGAPEQIADE